MAGEVSLVLEKIDGIESSQDLDALIRREVSARKGGSREPDPSLCPSCGEKNIATSKFCAECGAKLIG